MKKLLLALTAGLFAYTGAEAQGTVACGKKNPNEKNTLCRIHPTKGVKACYKTKYASNFKVCKGEAGYFICCQTPSPTNSTHYSNLVASRNARQSDVYTQKRVLTSTTRDRYYENAVDDAALSMVAPQSQSYPFTPGTTAVSTSPQANHLSYYSSGYYQGYNPRKSKIKVCYAGDNVAELNKAPYQGCNAPAWDGVEKNNVRNLNVVNTTDNPPIDGSAY
jgi:hypothetical protein